MGNVIDASNISDIVEKANEINQEQPFNTYRVSDYHPILTVRDKKQVIFTYNYEHTGVTYGGVCKPPEADARPADTEKIWATGVYGQTHKQCFNEIQASIDAYHGKIVKRNPDWVKRSETDLAAASMIASIRNAQKDSILFKAWGADINADTVGSGGDFKNGTNLALFNGHTGFFKQIEEAVASSDIPNIVIPENKNVGFVNQTTLDASRAYKTLQQVWGNADTRLQDNEDSIIFISPSMYRNLRFYMEDQSTANGLLGRYEEGSSQLAYAGIPIIQVTSWGRLFTNSLNNGTSYLNPNRCILTTKTNLPLGTLNAKDFDKIEFVYDEVERQVHATTDYTLDAKTAWDYLLSVAGFDDVVYPT
jgi:hypothetical protein